MKDFLNTIPKHIWILAILILVGIFFRVYHFDEWLQFKGDAFRDATMISNVYREGIESLPLLGPRAGGTMLRLGPVFYDFQSTSAFIFQSVSAPVLAYPDLFFSILALPLFFLFSRRYFSPLWSLAMAGMLATSFLAIEYGRFAWNPNSTLFFTLVFSYTLLKLYDTESERKRPLWWAFVAGISLAIASQLHFSAFLGLPLALALFVLLHLKDAKKVLSYKVILVFLVSVGLVYLPVFLSEYFKHGENTRLFLSAISSKASSHGIFQNIFQDMMMFAKYFVRILLGIVEPGNKLLFLSGIFCGTGFLANILLLHGEDNKGKRNFLQWTIILMTVYFLLYIPLAFKIDRPRFSLPFMMMPYIYFGYILVLLRRSMPYPRLVTILTLFGLGIILYSNVYATMKWFTELHNSQQTITSTGEKNSKGKSFWLTWGHFERAAEAMDRSCERPNTIYFSMEKRVAEYDHSIEYALLQRKFQWNITKKDTMNTDEKEGCYYFISFPHDTIPEFIAHEKQDSPIDAGNLWVIQLYLEGTAKEKFLDHKVTVERTIEESVFEPEKITRYSRVYWGDIWYKMSR